VELADTSAWTNRTKYDAVFADFDGRMFAGEIATCSMVVTELLWTAQNTVEFREQRGDLQALPQLEITERMWTRAIDVWQELVERGRHRQITPPDLLIAAAAELAGVGLCHYDRDFDTIAEITGQPVRAIAPLGSLS
jgi:predicted nucleic acid-binding protein